MIRSRHLKGFFLAASAARRRRRARLRAGVREHGARHHGRDARVRGGRARQRGDYAYGSVVGDAARLVRIDPAGVVTDVATGLAPYAVTFGPDGRLYVSDSMNARLIALAPCAQL